MFDGPAWILARNRIVEENLAWAHGIADRVARRLPSWFHAEDLHGAVEIALIKESDRYRSFQLTPFQAFARQRITGACYDAIRRREYKERAHQPLEVEGEGGRDARIADPGPSPERLAELSEMKGVWVNVGKLPEAHARVIKSIYGDGRSSAETAKAMGVSEGWTSRLHSEGLAMLRKMMEEK